MRRQSRADREALSRRARIGHSGLSLCPRELVDRRVTRDDSIPEHQTSMSRLGVTIRRQVIDNRPMHRSVIDRRERAHSGCEDVGRDAVGRTCCDSVQAVPAAVLDEQPSQWQAALRCGTTGCDVRRPAVAAFRVCSRARPAEFDRLRAGRRPHERFDRSVCREPTGDADASASPRRLEIAAVDWTDPTGVCVSVGVAGGYACRQPSQRGLLNPSVAARPAHKVRRRHAWADRVVITWELTRAFGGLLGCLLAATTIESVVERRSCCTPASLRRSRIELDAPPCTRGRLPLDAKRAGPTATASNPVQTELAIHRSHVRNPRIVKKILTGSAPHSRLRDALQIRLRALRRPWRPSLTNVEQRSIGSFDRPSGGSRAARTDDATKGNGEITRLRFPTL